ncbi:hypothetical protein CAOG_02067 [Capsaspora owczarzaki ATCC 30864]|uniref:Glutathione S-transferase n=1 Tax=Capsaspora owczarzaki (strain ATCC 30864) TaxID=595528 RepID=A0A0D2X1H6_CAPO3|nr:hypothetical protein CAOG_02067 [Capsaspora owczarzaki ATCC 30864]KJE90824.1 hypothetical protein CAOG_002067 [Capsaspora owczarzaki ATCC 30864]|eukprot:XP_004348817.1 hypothetical protein CAOG_02067 [Capsaspora owczarzaki ATCC 30864]
MSGDGKYHVHYFAGRGLGEIARIALSEAGVEFEDHRFESLPADLKATTKFGQVPLLVTPAGDRINQSTAILRFIGATHGLSGKTALENAEIDQVIEGVNDIRAKYRALPADAANEERIKFFSTVLPQWLGYFEAILKKTGSGFYVGSNVTIADLYVYVSFDSVINKTADAQPIDAFPLVKAHLEAIAARPRIAAWIAKRPVSQW